MDAPLDTLIVGQGLAGSLLAWELLKRGQRVMVLDDAHRGAASTVAAGLFNPVTGQRLVKGPEVDACLPAARACYRELEQALGRALFIEKPLWRLFQDDKERQAWEKRRHDPGYTDYLGEPLPPMSHPHAPLGGFVQRHAGYLDTRALLDGLRDYLQQRQGYRQVCVDYRQIASSGEGVACGELRARRLIFCEGWRALANPWFKDLPLTPSRGAILTLHSEAALPDAILNQGRWLIPRGAGGYRLGSSYRREGLHEAPDATEIAGITAQMVQWFGPAVDYHVTAVQSGVRPNSADKQPLLGMHPRQRALGVFNGFGSRGSLLIPWHAARMAEWLCQQRALPASVSIERL